MSTRRHMVLGAFLYPTGYHVAAWRHPEVPPRAGVDLRGYEELARTAERGLFDFLFLPDSSAMRGTNLEVLSRSAIRYVAQLEPLTLIAALIPATRHIGLAATVSSTYTEPFTAARVLASLDHLSGGRIAWNLVTSQNPHEGANYAVGALGHDARYERAEEFVDVVRGLWDTWDDGALVADQGEGRFFDPAAVRVLEHDGEHFVVRGPLNLPRPPQGHPVTLQAGSSGPGRELAARTADVVFTAQNSLEGARAFVADLRDRAENHGRRPEDVKVLVGLFPFVGRTEDEAVEKRERLQALIDPAVGLSLLASELGGIDLSGCPIDGPLHDLPPSQAGRSRQELLVETARREGWTIRELAANVAGSRGHRQVVGDPEQVADMMAEWTTHADVDGFIVMPPALPGDLVAFTELVLPVLRRRGLARTSYAGTTLRDHLGVGRPRRGS